jgi:hypothetical protein
MSSSYETIFIFSTLPDQAIMSALTWTARRAAATRGRVKHIIVEVVRLGASYVYPSMAAGFIATDQAMRTHNPI